MNTAMTLHGIDYGIIIVYLLITLGIGIWLERKASANADAFFLGGRKLPWWALGASGMASNVDISGTTLAVGLIYAMGVSGFFVEIRGGIVLVMALFIAFMGKWNRRSGAMTTAEWMSFRFGRRPEGRLARGISASAEVLGTIPIIAYFALGLETFVGPLVPEGYARLVSAALILIIVIYTTSSGLIGVVWTDVFQGGVILLGVLYICFLGFNANPLPETFQTSVPLGDNKYALVEHTAAEWSSAVPKVTQEMPGLYAQYNDLGKVITIFIFLTIVAGSSGGGGYMAQRYLAAKNEREAGLIGLFWTLLLSLRWPMVISFAILGIHYGIQQGMPIENPESVLPTVLRELVPSGMRGLLIACFLAAFMSTFSSFVNATSAYWSNDLFREFIRPDATAKQQVMQGRFASVIIVALGMWFSYQLTAINNIWGWLTGALGAGLAVPMLLRWYWWRFNGWGFAVGTLFGMVGAFALPKIGEVFFQRGFQDIEFFMINGTWTLIGAVTATLMTAPPEDEVLMNFYKTTRPFGFWGPVKKLLPVADQAQIRKDNLFEVANAAVAIPWQLCLFLLPMAIILKSWGQAGVLLLIVAVLSTLLYITWYRQLSKEK